MKFLHLVLTTLIFLSFTHSVQAIEPADNVIKGALADIERFEQQSAGLTPARSSNARRILKLMNLSQERLQSSSNQNDAHGKLLISVMWI